MFTRRNFHILAIVVVLIGSLSVLSPSLAQTGQTIYVKGKADVVIDDGNCTLREAILAANTDQPVDACPAGHGADEIILPAGFYQLTLSGGFDDLGRSGDLDITAPLTITAKGSGAILSGYIDDTYPSWYDRSMQVHASAGQVVLKNLIFQDNPSYYNGAALNNAADLRLEGCRFLRNGSPDYETYRGGAIYNSGSLTMLDSLVQSSYSINSAVYNLGSMHIIDSELSRNRGDDGDWGAAITNHGDLHITGSSLTGNFSGGGSAIVNSGTLLVEDSHLDSNSARFFSPALANGGTAELINTSLDNNNSGHYIGAVSNSGTLTISHASISNNLSYNWAGALQHGGGQLTLDDVVMDNNRTDGDGGALYLIGGSVELHNVQISNNSTSMGKGGGIYNANTILTITDSTISGNEARGDGAGMYLGNSPVSLSNVNITGNHINLPTQIYGETNNGAGVYQTGGDLTLIDSQVTENWGVGDGGGIYSNATLSLTNTQVNNNQTEIDGAGIFFTGSGQFTDVDINGNVAQDNGGGLYNTGQLSITGADIKGNWSWTFVTGQWGGGGITNHGTINLSNANLNGNWSIGPGGGISNLGTLAIANSALAGNVSRDWGGGIWQGAGTLDVVNTTFAANRGDGGGGGLGLQDGTANLQSTTFSENVVAIGWGASAGGGLLAIGGELTIHNTILAGNLNYYGDLAETLDCQIRPGTTLINLGYNLVGMQDGCNWQPAIGDQIGSLAGPLDAGLLPWQPLEPDTSGLVPMHHSPVIDTGDPDDCPSADQRGISRPQGNGCDIGAIEAVPQTIAIDIKPVSSRNVIDIQRGGRVPVAIFSAPGFDPVGDLDLTTVRFGHSGLEDSLYWIGDKPVCQPVDHNQDGVLDYICEFVIPEAALQCGDQAALLTAFGNDRRLFSAQDAVIIIPCP